MNRPSAPPHSDPPSAATPCLWATLLDALPVPAAVLAGDGRMLYGNAAYRRTEAGLEADAVGAGVSTPRALKRQTFRQQAVRSQAPVYFDEVGPDGDRVLWLYTPLVRGGAGGAEGDLVAVGFSATDFWLASAAEARQELRGRVEHEIRVPLAALVALVNSLSYDLDAEKAVCADQIKATGQTLLRQLRDLTTGDPMRLAP